MTGGSYGIFTPEVGNRMPTATMESISFQVLSLVVVVFYMWMLYYYRRQVVAGLKNALGFRDRTPQTASGKEVGGDNRQRYDDFRVLSVGLGALGAGIAIAKADILSSMLPASDGMPALVVFGTGVVWVAIMFVQIIFLKAAGGLTVSGSFSDAIIDLRHTHLAALSVVLVPLVIIVSGINPVRDRFLTYIIAVVIVAFAIMFTASTLGLFVRQKVSLLVWFLYLCTVEVFPISALVLLAVKIV